MRWHRGVIHLVVLVVLAALAAGCGGGGGGGSKTPSFALELPAPDFNVVAGTSRGFDLLVTPVGGFGDAVDLSLVDVPAGITAQLVNTALPGGGGATRLTVSAPATTTAGDYPFTIRGVSGLLTVDIPARIKVVLVAPDRFEAEADLSSLTVVPGQGAVTTLTLTRIGSFTGQVTLAAVGLPAGAEATFDPAEINNGEGTTTVTIDLNAQTAPGIYPVQLRGSGGSHEELEPLALIVPPAPAASGLNVGLPSYTAVRTDRSTVVGVTVKRDLGVTGAVTFSAVSPPKGISLVFAENPCDTAGTALTVNVASSVQPGVYPLTVRATAASSSGTAGMVLRVEPAASPADAWLSRVELAQTYIAEDCRLVPGKPALVRAHVLTDTASVASPKVLLTAWNGSNRLGTLVLAGPTSLPAREDAAKLAAGFTAELPKAWVADGLRLRIDLDPDDVLEERDELNNARYLSPAVAGATRIDLVIVPITLDGRTGSAPDLYETLYRHWPLATLNISVRKTYKVTSVARVESNGDGWSAVLSEISSLRQSDKSMAYYYGAIDTGYGSGVAGMGYVGYPVSIGMDNNTGVASHEIGHNFGLRHAPSGSAGNPDANYPYTGGLIGTRGFNGGNQTLYAPTAYMDIMGYAGPKWVSDYNYLKVLARLEPKALVQHGGSGPAQPALLITGTLGANGVTLNPIQRVVRAVPRAASGTHRLILAHAGGRTEARFTPLEIGCGPAAGRVAHFALTTADPGRVIALSVDDGRRMLLDRTAVGALPFAPLTTPLTITEQAGQARIRWDAATWPHATVVHLAANGARTTLGLWRTGGDATFSTRDLAAGGAFEVSLANGLRGERQVIAR